MYVSERTLQTFGATPFLGAWRLRSWDVLYADGRPPTYPYGDDAVGWLMYTPDGHMSVEVSRRRRAPLSTDNARKAPDAEKARAFDGYLAYSGSYSVDLNEVVHRVEFSLNPNVCGTEQRRTATFEGGRLILSAEETVNGVRRTHRLVWERPDHRRAQVARPAGSATGSA
jgi:hypothetical protein